MRIPRFFMRFPRSGAATEVSPHELEELLRTETTRIQRAGPETNRQWLLLQSALEQRSTVAVARRKYVTVRLFRPALAMTAGVVILLLAAQLWNHRSGGVSYATAKGQQSTIRLPDSSEVILNHTSTLVVEPVSEDRNRRVTLTGEAYFRIRKTGGAFTVTTDIGTVRVLGTEFNVRLRGELMEVAVLSGNVQVSAHRNDRDSTVELGAGEFSICARGGVPDAADRILFTDYPGWMHGKLRFARSTVATVVAEIADKFDVTVQIENAALKNLSITGSVDASSAESALSTITRLTGCTYRHENDIYILY